MSKKITTKDNTKNKIPKSEVILPAVISSKSRDLEIVNRVLSDHSLATPVVSQDPLSQYVKEISRYKLLTSEEEEMLIKEMQETGDIEVAKKLVLANLRLVVKIALEYRSAWQNVMDLIQEGNIGLMKAVSKYDATKGAKLSYYASWWIRSFILKYILDNFRLVKIGTTNEQKKLFFNLLKEKERLVGLGISPDNKMISANLGVSEKSVAVMDRRLGSGGSELSIEAKLDNEGPSLGDVLTNTDDIPIDERLSELQGVEILKDHLKNFLVDLKDRDREIFEKRLLSEVPASLQSIADQYGVSRERIRQIEERLINNLKVYMSEFIR
ncbi:MAG: sigma-70 family RNA polymerase sigma factor [Alphaproteobacteria bacterium]|nr:MAG: sigma-70 family RNA polymerase sigma factor [Alphaproteobacteria bacterium]